jgi:hypothetical protein
MEFDNNFYLMNKIIQPKKETISDLQFRLTPPSSLTKLYEPPALDTYMPKSSVLKSLEMPSLGSGDTEPYKNLFGKTSQNNSIYSLDIEPYRPVQRPVFEPFRPGPEMQFSMQLHEMHVQQFRYQ